MRTLRLTFSILTGSLCGVLPVFLCGQEAPNPALLGRLNSEQYADRAKAQAELMEWAEAGQGSRIDWLYEGFLTAEEPEVRSRVRKVLLKTIVDDYQRREGVGFVGIQMEPAGIALPDDPDSVVVGVKVSAITAVQARDAGLKIGDVILGLSDERWGNNKDPLKNFAQEVKSRRPGDSVRLEVLRGKELFEVSVKLGARPMGIDLARPRIGANGQLELPDMEASERQAQEIYFQQWLEKRRSVRPKP